MQTSVSDVLNSMWGLLDLAILQLELEFDLSLDIRKGLQLGVLKKGVRFDFAGAVLQGAVRPTSDIQTQTPQS